MVARIGLKSARPANIFFREWREWKGWSQQELADRLETTAATVSRIETGERDWGKGYLEAFAWVIGCAPADPITRPPNAVSAPDLLARLNQKSLADQQKILRIVNELLKDGTDG